MQSALSPLRLKRARRSYTGFNALNSLSFVLVAGNIITLYALALGASPTFIGLINAFGSITFFFMPVGKQLSRRFPLIRVFATAWLMRYLLMLPLLLAPLAVTAGRMDIALGCMLVSVIGFNSSRGIGMVGNNPLLDELAVGQDRGGFITYIQLVGSAVSMVSSLAIALILGKKPSSWVYGSLIAVGIITGILSSLILYRLPEPQSGADTKGDAFFATLRRMAKQRSFRVFLAVFFIISFIASMARTFAVVYTRSVYDLNDGTVALITVFGALGSLTMGFLTRMLVDKVGAKPLYVVYTAVAALSLLPAAISPGLGTTAIAVLYLSCFHFALNFGLSGTDGVAQTYFFSLVKPEEMLDLGIIYYMVAGAAGAAGSLSGGLALDALAGLGFSPLVAYRWFFGCLAVGLALVLFLQKNLAQAGALSIRGAIGVMFSFRDLRAINLINRLEKSQSPLEEEELLYALQEAPSVMALSGLLDALRSPLLFLRLEALRALEAMPELNEAAIAILLRDLEQHPYTTAYVSARVLGKHGITAAIPLLRRALDSDDYMLQGDAMMALARLADEDSLAAIETKVASSANPRLRIMGVAALKTYGHQSSIGVLLDGLRRDNPPPYLRDEIILALSQLIGIERRFYPVFVAYLDNPELGPALALDEVEANRANEKAKLSAAVSTLMETGQGVAFARWVYELPSDDQAFTRNLLAEAALDTDLTQYGRFRLLLACWAAYRLAPATARTRRSET